MEKFLSLLILLTLTSCGDKRAFINYGATTVADLVKTEGEPEIRESVPVPMGEVLTYPDSVKYQIQGEVVTAKFRNPEGDEKSLLYWKNKFKDCDIKLKKISLDEEEMACSRLGISVVHGVEAEFVARIVEYEAK